MSLPPIQKPEHGKYVLGLAFANYLTEKSGMPKAVLADQQTTNAVGVSYVYLFSVKKTLGRDGRMLFCEFGLIVDGSYLGIYSLSQILGAMAGWSRDGEELLEVHLHHLLYVDLKKVDELLAATDGVRVRVYLHDYYLCCATSYNLQREGDFCGASRLGDGPCEGCPHHRESARIEGRIWRVLDRYRDRVSFVAPSEDVKGRFSSFHPDCESGVEVVPHQKPVGRYFGNREPIGPEDPIRIAYLGMPKHMKGWDTWTRVHEALQGCGYEFYVFNSDDEEYEGMTHVRVAFDAEHPNAMVDALRRSRVSQAMLYTTCPETYSYTCMEAWAANSYILTSTGSGNVYDFVRSAGCGLAFGDEGELLGFLEDRNHVIETINDYRQRSRAPEELVENDRVALELPDRGVPVQAGWKMHARPIEGAIVSALNRLARRS